MSKLVEMGLLPTMTKIDFLKLVNRGLFPNLTPKDIRDLIISYKDQNSVSNFREYLGRIVDLFGKGWSVFADDFTSLDLGCGAYGGDNWYPWLPAILSQLGADATGIDIGTQPPQLEGLYTHIQFDLTQLTNKSLVGIPEIEGMEFNLITFLYTITPMFPSPAMEQSAGRNNMRLQTVQSRLFNVTHKLVKEGGIVMADTTQGNSNIFRKTDGILKRISI